MDKELLEAIRGAIRETIKGEIAELTEVMTDGFEYLNNKLDKEVAALRSEISAVALEVLEVKQLVRRIDDRTQHQTEAMYEEVRVTQKEVAKIQDHIGLPRTFPVAA